MAKKIKAKKLTVIQQGHSLQKTYAGSTFSTKKSSLIWTGNLKPSALSRTYTIKLTYKLERKANVYVLKPKLKIPDGKKLPHVFKGERLCLYYKNEWDGYMFLSQTIVPWSAEWLFNYEIWLATGQWCGGGIHSPNPHDKEVE